MNIYKKCPSCGYKNSPESVICHICSQDIKQQPLTYEKTRKSFFYIFPIAIFFIFAFSYLYLSKGKKEKDDFLLIEEENLNLPQIKVSLYGISKLKIPDEPEEKLVFESLENIDDEVKILAFKTLFIWTCRCPSKKEEYLSKLISYIKRSKNSIKKDIFKMMEETIKKEKELSNCLHQNLLEVINN